MIRNTKMISLDEKINKFSILKDDLRASLPLLSCGYALNEEKLISYVRLKENVKKKKKKKSNSLWKL